MRPSFYLVVFFLVTGLLIQTPGSARELAIYTEENPPVNFTKDGKPTGSSVAVVTEILRRLNQPGDIKVTPWARCYNLLKSKSNVVLFSVARTAEREELFQWIGPIYVAKTGFYARKENNFRFESIAEIKKVGAIATYKEDVREQILKSLGFTNLDSSGSPLSNIKKLAAGRVDLWFYDNLGMPQIARQAGVDPGVLELAYTFKAFDGYIAMSKKMPSEIAGQWQQTLDQMKSDGTFARLSLKWLPLESLPKNRIAQWDGRNSPERLAIYTENNPPGNYIVNGQPAGFVVDLVRELLGRLHHPDTIEVVPWARGYNLALSQPNVALFSTTRLPQREHLFQWVGPVYTQQWGLYAKKGTGVQIRSLGHARKGWRIGTYHNDAKEQYLIKKGFANLISANKNISNVKHLFHGDIDMWVSSDFNMAHIVKQAGFDPARLERVFAFHTVDNYIALSVDTPSNVVAAWQQTLDEIKRDGTYDKIRAAAGLR